MRPSKIDVHNLVERVLALHQKKGDRISRSAIGRFLQGQPTDSGEAPAAGFDPDNGTYFSLVIVGDKLEIEGFSIAAPNELITAIKGKATNFKKSVNCREVRVGATAGNRKASKKG